MGGAAIIGANKQCACGEKNSVKHFIFDCEQVEPQRVKFLKEELEIRKSLPRFDFYNQASPTIQLANALVARMQPYYSAAQTNWYYEKVGPKWDLFLAGSEPHQPNEVGGQIAR